MANQTAPGLEHRNAFQPFHSHSTANTPNRSFYFGSDCRLDQIFLIEARQALVSEDRVRKRKGDPDRPMPIANFRDLTNAIEFYRQKDPRLERIDEILKSEFRRLDVFF